VRRVLEWLARNWKLKLAALGISVLLWSIVKAEEVVSVDIPDVPVHVNLRDPAWTVAATSPARVSVAVTGPVRDIMRLAIQRPRIDVPVEEVQSSVVVIALRASWVRLPGEGGRTTVDDFVPSALRLVFSPVVGRADHLEPGAVAPAAQSAAAAPAPGTPVPAVPQDTSAPRDSAALRRDSARPRVRS